MAHVIWGIIIVSSAVYHLIFDTGMAFLGYPHDQVVDLVFGLSISITSIQWLVKGRGWGRYVAYVWLLFIALGVYVVSWLFFK